MLRLREPNYRAFKVLPYRVFAACFYHRQRGGVLAVLADRAAQQQAPVGLSEASN
jgi:hypothetical protein